MMAASSELNALRHSENSETIEKVRRRSDCVDRISLFERGRIENFARKSMSVWSTPLVDERQLLGSISKRISAPDISLPGARSKAIKSLMLIYKDECFALQTFTVFVGTWNVHGESPNESLKDWLSVDPIPPDIVAVGFQELDHRKAAYIFEDSRKTEKWLTAVTVGLNSFVKYRMIKLVRLVGIMMIVFVKEELTEFVQNVAEDTVGTGILGKLGNKGGVAIRMDFHHTSICFVNCHLAAHIGYDKRRNENYKDICDRINFNQLNPTRQIKDHDHIYWMGDMNYRIFNLEREKINDLIDEKCYSILLQHDQLIIQAGLQNVFNGFIEGPVDFKPTFKFISGTNSYDSESQLPAWCDRILWKGDQITQMKYRSHPTFLGSDHKPVSALFDSKIKVWDLIKQRKAYWKVMRLLDNLENEFLPKITPDRQEINFNIVNFLETKTETVSITNTGQGAAFLKFKTRMGGTQYCKEWLTISPHEFYMVVGEKCDVSFKIRIDQRTAYKFNAGVHQIDDILTLHLEGGRDIFMLVTGTYVRGCFGASLEVLVRIPGPVSEVPLKDLAELEQSALRNTYPGPQQIGIPKEICIMVKHLYKFGLNQEGLFLQPGHRGEFLEIREKLDKGIHELQPCSIHSVAESLLIFLEALAEPVIPYEFFYRSLDCSNNFHDCRNLVNEIPPVHKSVFKYIVFFLRDVVYHAPDKETYCKEIAAVFGGILMREPLDNSEVSRKKKQEYGKKMAIFLYNFLINNLEYF